jgi:hypothetical protein
MAMWNGGNIDNLRRASPSCKIFVLRLTKDINQFSARQIQQFSSESAVGSFRLLESH